VVFEGEGIFDVVRLVAVDADGDILIVFIEEGIPVNAVRVYLVNRRMALLAPLGG
jgi:hypothetical protein